MLDLEEGESPLVEPNWPLVEECRRILARLNVADRAYQLLKSQSRQANAPDWVAARHAGPDFATVFETTTGDNIESVVVPGFFTYAGFQKELIDKLPTIAEQLQRDNWVLGDAGKLGAITSQFDNLTRDLLNLYGQDFQAAWKQALERLRMRPLNVGKPKYDALNAAAASTSPIRLLIESIRDETALTRERKDAKDSGKDSSKDAAKTPKKELAPSLVGAQTGVPGASIEAEFRPFHQVVEGDGSRRLIDTITGDLGAINNTLQTVALNSSQEQQATGAIRGQVAQFKTDAVRMPSPFNTMLLQSANAFENTIADDTYRQIRDEFQKSVYGPCQSLASNRYPMDHGAKAEIGLADFGRLFGGNGYFDGFFKKYLDTYADTSQRDWKWRQENPVAKLMSVETLRQFQRAARIRDAFFPTNGNVPQISLNITPPVLAEGGLTAKLEVNGLPVTSSNQPNPAPVAVQWPGSAGKTAVSLVQDLAAARYAGCPAFGNLRRHRSVGILPAPRQGLKDPARQQHHGKLDRRRPRGSVPDRNGYRVQSAATTGSGGIQMSTFAVRFPCSAVSTASFRPNATSSPWARRAIFSPRGSLGSRAAFRHRARRLASNGRMHF